MDFDALYHFFFQTYAGLAALVGIFLVATLLVSVVLERRTRKRFKNHEKTEDDWSFFDDDDDEEESK